METQLHVGDCVPIMRRLCAQGRWFSLVFADPPFNIGEKYSDFNDNMTKSEFMNFMINWIHKSWNLVAPGGAMALHGSVKMQPVYWEAIASLALYSAFEGQVVWHYRFGQCGYSNWVNSHCPCLVFRKPGARKWYPENVLVESDRATKYNDKRASQGVRSGSRPPLTVFGTSSDGPGWGRVTGNSKERWHGHSNQLPCRYVSRLVRAYTQPGDWVLDPFLGTGTTGLVCEHEQRNFVGIDISATSVASARKRIDEGYYPEDLKQPYIALLSTEGASENSTEA